MLDIEWKMEKDCLRCLVDTIVDLRVTFRVQPCPVMDGASRERALLPSWLTSSERETWCNSL